jgi:hypothetical protein
MPPQGPNAGGGAPPAAAEAAALPNSDGTGFHTLSFSTCSNQFLIGTQQVAWLHFTAISNQSSAFVPLLLDNTVGHQPDGSEVRNFAPQAGRVVVVGEEPLLEALRTVNGQVGIILYSLVGVTNVVETTVQLPVDGAWLPFAEIVATNLFNHLPPFTPGNQQRFYRAKSKSPAFLTGARTACPRDRVAQLKNARTRLSALQHLDADPRGQGRSAGQVARGTNPSTALDRSVVHWRRHCP